MVREKFEKPEMEMVTFDAEDIIVTSGVCNNKIFINCPTEM